MDKIGAYSNVMKYIYAQHLMIATVFALYRRILTAKK